MKDNWWGKSNQGTRTQTASINGTKNVATWSISSSGTYYFYLEKDETINILDVSGTVTN
jgi:uncharacterized cupin superfamily protein